MATYTGHITELQVDQIFVFGSNTEGRHGKGAALWAKQNAGAIYGQAKGLQGRSYAIVTKDLTKRTHPSVPMGSIIDQIRELYDFARANKQIAFLVAYSGRGANLNGYSNEEMAAMFSIHPIPDNIVFEEQFYELVKQMVD